jgi:hypothetical protein
MGHQQAEDTPFRSAGEWIRVFPVPATARRLTADHLNNDQELRDASVLVFPFGAYRM